MSDKEKRSSPITSPGTSLVAKLLPNTDPVHKVTIVSRGQALGYTMQLPTEDKHLTSRSEILNRLASFWAGAAPRRWSSRDHDGRLRRPFQGHGFRHRMVTEFGMSDKIGPLSLKEPDCGDFLGRDISRAGLFREHGPAHRRGGQAHRARGAGQGPRDSGRAPQILDDLATKLIDREILTGEELDVLFQGAAAWNSAPAGRRVPISGPSWAARRVPLVMGIVNVTPDSFYAAMPLRAPRGRR